MNWGSWLRSNTNGGNRLETGSSRGPPPQIDQSATAPLGFDVPPPSTASLNGATANDISEGSRTPSQSSEIEPSLPRSSRPELRVIVGSNETSDRAIHPHTTDDNRVPVELAVKVGDEEYSAELLISSTDENGYKRIRDKSDIIINENLMCSPPGEQIRFQDGMCLFSLPGNKFDGLQMKLRSGSDWPPIKDLVDRLHSSEDPVKLRVTLTFISSKRSSTPTITPEQVSQSIWFLGELKKKRQWSEPWSKTGEKGSHYISRSDFEELMSIENIKSLIGDDPSLAGVNRPAFAEDIYRKARKLMALFVYARCGFSFLKELMDNGYDDSRLPLGPCPNFAKNWIGDPYEDLLAKQWVFLAPIFMGEHLELHKSIPIPFTHREECGEGAFSTVYKVRVEPSHLRHPDIENPNAELAVKILWNRNNRGGSTFNNERSMLEEVRHLQHRHIVKLLFTYRHGETYHMVFPLASCNLREFISRSDPPKLSQDVVIWLLSQLFGLVHALHRIHNYTVSDPKLLDALQIPQSRRMPESSTASRAGPSVGRIGIHHDLKPENILCFSGIDDKTDKHGIFQISDFGLAQFHTIISGSWNRDDHVGTPAYTAPEAAMKGKRSRPYDVWSLGCIFLEILVWLITKRAGWEAFTVGRKETVITGALSDDAFFIVEEGVPKVRDSVKASIENLRQHPACRGRYGLSGVITLVEEMLDVTPTSRITTVRCCGRLKEYLRYAKEMDAVQFSKTVDEYERFQSHQPFPTFKGDPTKPVVRVQAFSDPPQNEADADTLSPLPGRHEPQLGAFLSPPGRESHARHRRLSADF